MRNWTRTHIIRGLPSIALGAACAVTMAATLAVPVTVDAADRLGNISTRGKVSAGAGRMRAGFIIQGDTEKCAVVRARGPSVNFAGAKVDDPKLTLMDNVTGQVLAENDNWKNQPASGKNAIIDAGLQPGNDKEAAIYFCFEPNHPYTTIVEGGSDSDTGVAIAEVLDADSMAELEVVNGDLAALQDQIDDLTALVNSLQSQIGGLQAQAHDRYTNAEAVSAVGPHFSGNYNHLSNKPSLATVATTGSYYDLVDEPDGGGGDSNPVLNYMDLVTIDGVPNVVVSGANFRVHSNGVSGRGNLIVGPNDGCGSCTRTGQNSLIVGPDNEWKSNGGVVFGQNNALDASWGSILGGAYNTITNSGTGGSIVTGTQNFVMTSYGAIVGGKQNETVNLGSWGAVLGGQGQRSSDYNYQTKYDY